MRSITALFVCLVILLTGCADPSAPIDMALKLRNEIENSNGCAFQTTITADYGETVYTFSMDCQTDSEGNLGFTVSKPESIAGISGRISSEGGALSFEDRVLAFQTMADGLVTPVTAPWIFIKTLKSGYIKGCAATNNGFEISADDSYADGALHLQLVIDENVPVSCEIYWNGRRTLTMTVENFRYL